MSVNYQYIYAEIDLDTNECIHVFSTSTPNSAPCLVELEVDDPEYISKYYIDGNWYEDAEGTIPWQSSLI